MGWLEIVAAVTALVAGALLIGFLAAGILFLSGAAL